MASEMSRAPHFTGILSIIVWRSLCSGTTLTYPLAQIKNRHRERSTKYILLAVLTSVREQALFLLRGVGLTTLEKTS